MNIMKKMVILMAVVFVCSFLVYAADKAPDFNLKDIQGNQITLSGLKGKVVVLNFWATWCPPCKMEIPELVKTYEKYKDKGFVIIGVVVSSKIDNVKELIKKYKITYTIALSDNNIEKAYGGINAVPTTFIIDREGNLVPGGKKIGMFVEGELEKIVAPFLK